MARLFRKRELVAVSLSKNFNLKVGKSLLSSVKIDLSGYMRKWQHNCWRCFSRGLPRVITRANEFYLNDCKARIVIVEDQEQVDKLLEIEDRLPFVEHIIYYNKQGLRHYKHSKLSLLDDLMQKGARFVKRAS